METSREVSVWGQILSICMSQPSSSKNTETGVDRKSLVCGASSQMMKHGPTVNNSKAYTNYHNIDSLRRANLVYSKTRNHAMYTAQNQSDAACFLQLYEIMIRPLITFSTNKCWHNSLMQGIVYDHKSGKLEGGKFIITMKMPTQEHHLCSN